MSFSPEPPGFRHLVITGASSGIGAALAKHYAHPATTMSVLGRNAVRIEEIAQTCRLAGASVYPSVGDVADAAFMTQWLESCEVRAPVDLVIANAGIGGGGVLTRSSTEALSTAHEVFSVNVMGVANTILPILPRMIERRRGHLVLLSSLAGYIGLAESPAYCASKAAVRIYGDALRRLLEPHGVHVTVVCPGFVKSPMSDSLPGRLPFLWDTERAARHIAAGVARAKHEIAFPWSMVMLLRLAGVLPSFVLEPILDRVSRNRVSV